MPYQTGFREGLFEGQTLLIPGGGGGLGRCIAHELAALGAKLVLAGRTMENLERTQAEISEDDGEVVGCQSMSRRPRRKHRQQWCGLRRGDGGNGA